MIYIIFLSLIFGVILFYEKVKNLSSSSGGQTIGIYEGFFLQKLELILQLKKEINHLLE